jgi:hypothetical protein
LINEVKEYLKGKVMTLLTYLTLLGLNFKLIEFDESDENKALFEECQSMGYNVKFEFNDPQMPQRNIKV